MTLAAFFHLTAPQANSATPRASAIESFFGSYYDALAFARKELKAIYEPDDLKGTLTDWDDHEPLLLEYTRDSMGKAHLESIRIRGAVVQDYLMTGLWSSADEWLQENVSDQPSESRLRLIERMDRTDERQERAA